MMMNVNIIIIIMAISNQYHIFIPKKTTTTIRKNAQLTLKIIIIWFILFISSFYHFVKINNFSF